MTPTSFHPLITGEEDRKLHQNASGHPSDSRAIVLYLILAVVVVCLTGIVISVIVQMVAG